MNKITLNFRESYINLKNMKLKNYYGQDHEILGGERFYQSLTGKSGCGYFTKTALVKKVSQYRTDLSKLNEVTVESPLDFGDILIWVFNPYEYHQYRWDFSSHYPVVTFSLHVETGNVFINLIDSDTIDIKSIIEKIRSGYKDPDMDLPYKPFETNIDKKNTFFNYEVEAVHVNMNGISGMYIPLKLMFSEIFVKGDTFGSNFLHVISPKGDPIYKIGITEDLYRVSIMFYDEQGLYPIRLINIDEQETEKVDIDNDIKVNREDSDEKVTIFLQRDLRKVTYFQLIEISKSDSTYLVSEIRISEEKFMIDFSSDEEKVKETLKGELHPAQRLLGPDGKVVTPCS